MSISRVLAAATVAAVIVWGTAASGQSIREVTATSRTLIPIDARVRFTTMVILPEAEEILDIICGDKDFWIVSGVKNFAYIKPAKAGASTNVNLVTKSGAVYSFLLKEGAANADLKVFVRSDQEQDTTAAPVKWYSQADVDAIRRDADAAVQASVAAIGRAEADRNAAVQQAQEEVVRARATSPTTLQFPYRFTAHKKPFRVEAIYRDTKATYIRFGGTELPAVYELADGGAALVNVQVQNGVLVVPKVLDRGYLALGKARLFFETQDR